MQAVRQKQRMNAVTRKQLKKENAAQGSHLEARLERDVKDGRWREEGGQGQDRKE